jgi:hypothetical protein
MAANCTFCDEPVLPGEEHAAFGNEPMHHECGFRSIVGPVAHLLRRCHCYKLGSTLSDPPNLTKRQAALAAFALARQITQWYGEEEVDL